MNQIEKAYELAKTIYKSYGVDTDAVIRKIKEIPISVHCWQGDDISGFLFNQSLSGGIAVTGNYKYKARNPKELRSDLDKAISLVPGKLKVNLHAIYAESTQTIDLNQIEPKHFKNWVEWAKAKKIGLDFNPTCFAHPLSEDGFTLSHKDKNVRDFWIDHVKKSRAIAAYFSKELGTKAVCNLWIPDGYKDNPYNRVLPRKRLIESLDEIYQVSSDQVIDTLESKLFGIGTEAYTVGSHEFYMSYAQKNNLGICLDSGHFHPTESVADKLATLSLFNTDILLHVSRPMRWDSDHVVIMDDALSQMMEVVARNDLFHKVHIGLDFFDASINRVAAWVIGIRSTQKTLLKALLEPSKQLEQIELNGDYTQRLALTEELKSLPFGIVYDYYCHLEGIPQGNMWFDEIKLYEQTLKGNRT